MSRFVDACLLLFAIHASESVLPTKIITIMFENRSFDNVLGYLHNGTAKASEVEGVIGKNITNPIPDYVSGGPAIASVRPGTVFNSPPTDPGESYPHTMTQMYGDFLPSSNYGLEDINQLSPYNLPSQNATPNMQGFAMDFASVFNQTGQPPNVSICEQIMNVLHKEEVPVIYTIAENFLVFDHWFCDVPSMTYCNRRFFQAGTSDGYVLNHIPDFGENPAAASGPTIFNQLESAGKTWKVYYPLENVLSISLLIDFNSLSDYHTHFVDIEELYRDLQNNELSDYSFIEPVFLGSPSDYHPSDSDNVDSDHSSVLSGEGLLSTIYEAISNSSMRDEIVFFITFDEFGGTADHVPPPATNPPNASAPQGEFNFTFDRLGGRVPSIMVNSYITPGTVYKDQLQHTSFMGFVRTILGMNSSALTERDRLAPQINLSQVFTDTHRGAWPVTTPRNFTAPTSPVVTLLGKYVGSLTSDFSTWLASTGRSISNWWENLTNAGFTTRSSWGVLLATLLLSFTTVF